ncbi:MAG: ribonuclease R [Candidatus Taylorbacteria bacterium RIFCSPHIGHO2_01_FULL_45_63]|uniref:Ribonuclease R n=1 Tax=Candidatus Taylorbacteria bacterium RIFCSPHIGHO2_02_FULL_45_35 TaxID=1802311 RepID=A0A1G2MXF0_9BACT|nr:MAG: ribonuclease R [Candidatus Taylorbacteria bacterium RIFCSPHIGHO2_01_FULL_45_63]OHA27879.1 MAG: ribonuclease R [Candidatus Taylorbacteria bacterium RIFCSPHIGHO2_02_FULL_45_35]OHA32441.1 MAG: ribonuclease R [Candidatus Taylorbacteria bacterium RIFCSPLOWO2_01_FULL_45_34b]
MKQPRRKEKERNTNKPLESIISVNSKGVGFVEHPDFEDDIRIEEDNMNTALHGDTVRVSYKKEGREVRGTVTDIIKRARTRFVGSVEKNDDQFTLVTDDKRVYVTMRIVGGNDEMIGKKVQVEMEPWSNPRESPRAVVRKIIGQKGNNDAEMESIVLEKGLAIDFPEEVKAEADRIGREAAISATEIAARRDFRHTPTFTIDPADAKDFDDALSLRKISEDTYEVGVHIADVSHYVRENTPLDREASARGCSIYLVDRTIPMLPPILSDNLCSLLEGKDKLTFSAVFTMKRTSRGWIVTERWFGKTIINSSKRFSYEDAQKILNEKTGRYYEELNILDGISKQLRAEKFKKGAIDFEQDEVKFVLDATGRPLRVYKKERLDTHKLVEELMLLANREVAEYIYRKEKESGMRKPFIYRIHDLPKEDRITELALFVKALGHDLPIGKEKLKAKDFSVLFERIRGKGEESLVKTAAIRSMAKAIYSTKNIGHFGLAFPYYTHFTSPIRRYPDTLVHRLLDAYLSNKKMSAETIQKLEGNAAASTDREIDAAEAERQSVKLKQVEYMKERVGQTFDGVVSGVTEWGIYVEDRETKSEGLVRLKDLENDYYEIDQKNYRVIGKKTKKKYTLGDPVRFTVMGADIERKTLDFKLNL